MVNIDRLHRSILNWNDTFSTRRSGKTTILLTQIIAEIQLGISQIVLVSSSNYKSIQFYKESLIKLLEGQPITVLKTTKDEILFLNEENKEVRVRFVVPCDESKLKGYSNHAHYMMDF